MKKIFMIEFDLLQIFDEEFMVLIFKQCYIINIMLVDGRVKVYFLFMDWFKFWAIMIGIFEFEVMENIVQLLLSEYMSFNIFELMFYNILDVVMQFFLN